MLHEPGHASDGSRTPRYLRGPPGCRRPDRGFSRDQGRIIGREQLQRVDRPVTRSVGVGDRRKADESADMKHRKAKPDIAVRRARTSYPEMRYN